MANGSISEVNNYLSSNDNERAVSKLQELILRSPKVPYYYSLLSMAYDCLNKEEEAYFSNVQWSLLSNYKLNESVDNNFFYNLEGGQDNTRHNFDSDTVLIVVPVYNAEDTIEECIGSLINQSYRNISIVAVDDCSTDSSAKKLKRLELIHPNLIVFLSPINLGTYNAINLGLYLVRNFDFGYFCGHGADDLMHKQKLELQIKQMKANCALGCIAGYRRIDINTKAVLSSSNSGHSMAIFRREVFDKLGYYYDTRFGGDSEYWQRFIKCFGIEKVCSVTKPLTEAYFGENNLTKLNNEQSKARLNLVKAYELMHEDMYKDNKWFLNYNLLEKLSIKASKIICGMATIPGRQDALKETVQSILPQVDKLIVYQNGFKESYPFLNSSKVEVISSLDTEIDMGDAGKFFKVNQYSNHYYFSIDDDIIYPSDYVETMLNKLKSYNNRVIVTLHARILNKNAKSYYKDVAESFRCLDKVDCDRFVHFGGTGVMAFHTSNFNMSFDICKAPNMADIWVGLYARQKGIPILVAKHQANWLQHSDKYDHEQTIYRTYKSKHGIQNRLIQSFDSTYIIEQPSLFSDQTMINSNKSIKKKIVFLSCSYKREDVSFLFRNSLLKLQNNFADKYDFMNIVVDSEESNKEVFKNHPRFNYFDYPNLPISDKWAYGLHKLKDIDYDYVFMIGSDNTIDSKVFTKYSSLIDKGTDIIGITDMYAYSLEKDQLFYYGGYPKTNRKRYGETIGLGRCLSKRLIEAMNYELWDRGINKGLDGSMTRRLSEMLSQTKNTFTQSKFAIKGIGIACDIKGGFNITNLDDFIASTKLIEDEAMLAEYKRNIFGGLKELN